MFNKQEVVDDAQLFAPKSEEQTYGVACCCGGRSKRA